MYTYTTALYEYLDSGLYGVRSLDCGVLMDGSPAAVVANCGCKSATQEGRLDICRAISCPEVIYI